MRRDQFTCEWAQEGRVDRAVVFLRCPANKHVNAFERFEKLRPTVRRCLQRRFSYWVQKVVDARLHHGFTGEYAGCYVFKEEQGSDSHRLYGFLCHPAKDSRFLICVLVTYAKKQGRETDTSILDRIIKLMNRNDVSEAVDALFKTGGERQ